jgi:DNA-directed RNA polymerase subunit beta'
MTKGVCQLLKINFRDFTFYSAEEVNIALNEGRLELNARVKIRAKDFNEAGELVYKIIQTTAGRVIF